MVIVWRWFCYGLPSGSAGSVCRWAPSPSDFTAISTASGNASRAAQVDQAMLVHVLFFAISSRYLEATP